MRRHHVNFQVRMNEYKKPGPKKPGLQMDFIYLFIKFLWESLDWKSSLIS